MVTRIDIENLTVDYGKFHLKVEKYFTERRRNFIMGENGAGKSSFLKAIAGIIESRGKIKIDDTRIDGLPPWRRKVGYIPQNLLLFPQYKVWQNMAISIRYGHGDYEIYKELIDLMHLKDILERNINEISGGQQQRVAVARAIISKPRLLLMDEPFSMQDERSRMSLIANVAELLERYDISYIYVTHNAKDLDLGFDTLSIMHAGRIIESVDDIADLKTYEGLSLMDFRNIIKIDGRYYKINPEAVIPGDNGYACSCHPAGSSYVCTVSIDGEKFFIESKEAMKYVRFNLANAVEISRISAE